MCTLPPSWVAHLQNCAWHTIPVLPPLSRPFPRCKYISPEQAEAVQAEVAALCKELRPQALALVGAFGLPQHLLAPIAFDWVDYESSKYVPGSKAAQAQSADVSVYLGK